MKIFLVSLTFLAPLVLFSQKFNVPSKVITKSKDSIAVLTENNPPNILHSVRVMDPVSHQIRTYEAAEIQGLVMGSDYYLTAIVDVDQTPFNEEVVLDSNTFKVLTDTVLLKVEYVSPSLKLFSLSLSKHTHFFIQKDNGAIEELIYRKLMVNRSGTDYESEDKKFQTQLSDLLTDCPAVSESTNHLGYTVQSIESLLDKYNRTCKNQAVARYTKAYVSKVEVSAFLGASFGSFSYSDASGFLGNSNNLSLTAGVAPVLGLQVNYVPSILKGNLSLAADLFYSSFKAPGSYYSNYINDTFYTRKTLQVKDSYINFALLARYYLLPERKMVRPYLNIGYTAGFAVSIQNSETTDDYFDHNHMITVIDPFSNGSFNKTQLGYILGAGIAIRKFSIDYRYINYYSSYLKSVSITMSGVSNQVTVGYRLGK